MANFLSLTQAVMLIDSCIDEVSTADHAAADRVYAILIRVRWKLMRRIHEN